jgi:hypothetical protein
MLPPPAPESARQFRVSVVPRPTNSLLHSGISIHDSTRCEDDATYTLRARTAVSSHHGRWSGLCGRPARRFQVSLRASATTIYSTISPACLSTQARMSRLSRRVCVMPAPRPRLTPTGISGRPGRVHPRRRRCRHHCPDGTGTEQGRHYQAAAQVRTRLTVSSRSRARTRADAGATGARRARRSACSPARSRSSRG